MASRLSEVSDPGALGITKAGRILQTIRLDMDLKDGVMRERRRNEEVLSLIYTDGKIGGSAKMLRENALNLPYRYARWLEAQATSKRMVVKVSRDAGEGQMPGGPGDETTGQWVGITLGRVAYEAGYDREMRAVVGEVLPRGTSVMAIGYHEEVIDLAQSQEVGKDAQSIVPDVLAAGDVEAKEGQAHAEIAENLGAVAQDPMFQRVGGREGVAGILARKDSHDVAAYKAESDTETPKESTRLIRRKAWMRKKRVGEDVGWSPHVYDTEDAPMWWDRHVWTVAEVKASALFTPKFKAQVKGYDGRNVSGVARGAQTPSTESMSGEARSAQSENVLDDDERMVEWFAVWIRRPDMRAGGIRKIVCAECPEEFVEADESNPHVDSRGFCLIPGFFPFYDFTPIQSSLTIPERTTGVPPIAAGMPQFERLAEYGRLRHESALRHSVRMYQKHPGLKGNKAVDDAIRNGEDGFSFDCPPGALDSSGKMQEALLPIQFTGNTQEIERQAAREEGDWIKVMGMPPAVLNGVGTAETATQDQQGIAAGERESGALVAYIEKRMADVLCGIRGIVRGNYDDEDFVALLGEEGAEVMKAWQTGTVDDGDRIEVTFGERAQAQETVEKKQLMEAINLLSSQIDPVTGMAMYDVAGPIEELHRRLDLGPPKLNKGMLAQLQQLAMIGKQALQAAQGAQPGQGGAPSANGSKPSNGPNPSEGDGPSPGNIQAGAMRGTVRPSSFEAGS